MAVRSTLDKAVELALQDVPMVKNPFTHAFLNARRRGDKHRDIKDKAVADISTIELTEEQARMVYDFYRGVMLPYLDKLESETPDEFERRAGKKTMKLLTAVIDTLARLYDTTPVRAIIGEDHGYLQWLEANNFDGKSVQAERLGLAQGNGGWRLIWNAEEQKIELDWIRKEQMRVVENPENPAEPLAVIVRWSFFDDGKFVKKAIIYTKEEIVSYTDATEDPVLEGFDPGPNGKGYLNPYGIIPIALFRWDILASEFHTDGLGQWLSEENAEINNELSAAGNQVYMQAFTPIIERNNRNDDEPQTYGPNMVWSITGEDAAVIPLMLDSHLGELLEFIRGTVRELLYTMRIPEQAIIGSTDASGVAIVAANAPIAEMRRESMTRWRPVEKDLYGKWQVFEDFHSTGKLTRDITKSSLSVMWPDPKMMLTVMDEITRVTWELAQGLTDIVSIELSRNASAYAHIEDGGQRKVAALEAVMTRKEINSKAGATVTQRADDGGFNRPDDTDGPDSE